MTAAREAEAALQEAHAALAHITRLTTLGELATSIAHEVNQPLATIITNAEVCLRVLTHQEPNLTEIREAISDVVTNGRRAAEIIWRLRALSTKTATQRVVLDINQVIEEVIPLVQREVLSHRVFLRLDLAPKMLAVIGDRVQLQQVIINLIFNGMEAMASVSDRARTVIIRSRGDNNREVLVAVQDSGVGIDPPNVEQLFEAFFTTKPDGMGMGLSICRSIIEDHGGKLRAFRNSNFGATFQFTLQSHIGERPE